MDKMIGVSSYDEMERAAATLKEISESYTTIYKKMMRDVTMMGQAWEGEDNVAFVNQITGFIKKLDAMAEKLQTAGEALHQQKENYMQRQDQNIQQIRKLNN